MDVLRVTGVAQRRKQWRMRSWWRHEQVSIAAVVAVALHPPARRGGGVVGVRLARTQPDRAARVPSLECLPDQWSEVFDSPTVCFLVEEWKK